MLVAHGPKFFVSLKSFRKTLFFSNKLLKLKKISDQKQPILKLCNESNGIFSFYPGTPFFLVSVDLACVRVSQISPFWFSLCPENPFSLVPFSLVTI